MASAGAARARPRRFFGPVRAAASILDRSRCDRADAPFVATVRYRAADPVVRRAPDRRRARVFTTVASRGESPPRLGMG